MLLKTGKRVHKKEWIATNGNLCIMYESDKYWEYNEKGEWN